jgi:YVTN family beta-propeller protein
MEFRILGPLEVVSDGSRLPLGGAKQRAVLAYLLLHANEIVSTDRLVDELWVDGAPRRATKALQMHVLGLRRVLDEGRLETHGRGYRLRVEPGELDLEQVEHLAEQAARSAPAEAARLLRDALALFRGEPLGDVAFESFGAAESARLTELRLHLLEERVDADLLLDRHAGLVPELESLVIEHPLRERLRGQLMLALYRSGRQADALEAYRRGRSTLVESLGLEPGAELRQLEAAILRQDPRLGAARPSLSGRVRRRPHVAVLAGAVLVATAGAIAIAVVLATRSSPKPPVVVADSLVRIDAGRNAVAEVIPTGREPLVVVTSPQYLWVLNALDETVSRIDRSSRETRIVGGLSAPKSIALGAEDTLWVGSESTSFVVGLDVETLRLTDRIAVPGAPPAFIAVDGSTLWASQPNVGDAAGTVSVVDLEHGRVVRRYPVGGYTTEIAVGDGAAWVGLGDRDAFARIAEQGSRVQRIRVGRMPSGAAVGFGSAWTASYAEDKVWRVNSRTGRVESIVNVGEGPWSLAIGRDAVWVTNRRSGTISRIDPRTNSVVETIRVGYNPQGVVVDGDDVWVTVASRDIGI